MSTPRYSPDEILRYGSGGPGESRQSLSWREKLTVVPDDEETAKNGVLGSMLSEGPREVSREKPLGMPFLASSERDRRIRIAQLNVMERTLLRRFFLFFTSHSYGVLWIRSIRSALSYGSTCKQI